MNKKVILIIVGIIIVLICGIIGFLYLTQMQSNDITMSNNNNNVMNINENKQTNNSNNNISFDYENINATYEETTQNVISDAPQNTNIIENDIEENSSSDYGYSWSPEVGSLPNRSDDYITNDSGSDNNAFPRDAFLLERIDSALYKDTAEKFIWNLCSYDAESLRLGSYIGSLSPYVEIGSIPSDSILKERLSTTWSSTFSTYKEIFSRPIAVVSGTPYISHLSGDTEDLVAIRVVIDVNCTGIPDPPIAGWQASSTVKESWAVYFNGAGKILEAKMQYATPVGSTGVK